MNTVQRFLACLVLFSLPVNAQWSEWGGGPSRNMVSDASGLPEIINLDKAKWSARLSGTTYGSPILGGGKVIVGTNDASAHNDPRFQKTGGGMIFCFDAKTGDLAWKLVIPKFKKTDPTFNFDDLKLGVCNSATIEGNRVYIVDNRAHVLCLDLNGQADGNDGPFQDEGAFMAGKGNTPIKLTSTDADIIWRYDLINELPVWIQDAHCSAILVHGDLIYLGTSNGVDKSHKHVPYPDAPSLIAMDKKTGRLVARDDEKIGRRLFHGQWTSPTLGMVNGRPLIFYGGGDGVCYAFEPIDKAPPNGEVAILKKVWWFDCNPIEYRYDENGLNRRYNDKKKKGVGPSEIISTPVFYKNRVYVPIGQDSRHGTGKGALSCIDATLSGDITERGLIWRAKDVDRTVCSVSIADGLLYVGDFTGNLFCKDAETGEAIWKHKAGRMYSASSLVADGKVYMGTETRQFYILKAGREKEVLAKIMTGIATTPAVSDGVMYLATQNRLYAFEQAE